MAFTVKAARATVLDHLDDEAGARFARVSGAADYTQVDRCLRVAVAMGLDADPGAVCHAPITDGAAAALTSLASATEPFGCTRSGSSASASAQPPSLNCRSSVQTTLRAPKSVGIQTPRSWTTS